MKEIRKFINRMHNWSEKKLISTMKRLKSEGIPSDEVLEKELYDKTTSEEKRDIALANFLETLLGLSLDAQLRALIGVTTVVERHVDVLENPKSEKKATSIFEVHRRGFRRRRK